MNRRQLLLGSAAGFASAGLPAPAFVRSPVLGAAGALPMPAPGTSLPEPLPNPGPSRIRLERGWRFHEGDVTAPPLTTHEATYLSVKAGNAQGAAAMAYDDSDWPTVRLPHDWAAAQQFLESANISQGYRARGIGWYRRTLTLAPEDRGKRIELHFDGIATHATIWVNGSVLAHSWSGYSSVVIDMTPFARFGDEENVIAVRVDADAMEGWWYEGAGLYRHAWLVRRAAVAIATDGVYADPRRSDAGRWQVPVAVTLNSVAADTAAVSVEILLLDSAGMTVAQASTDAAVAPLDTGSAVLTLDVAAPALWSVEQPQLYTLHVRLRQNGFVLDERRVAIGFRSIRFDPDRGFFLNDTSVKLKGVCLHQDHAGVGVAVPDTLLRWRLERLKAMGCNAIRCSHGAPAAELLDLADRMGFMVMDENRLFNPAPDYLAQLEWLVRRDRNHPSVILWSVFNEEPMQASEAGVAMLRRLVHAVRALDDSRPVTAALNGSFFDPVTVANVVDVTGFNYYQDDYDRYHKLFPERAMTSSEDTSAYETRGAFADDPAAHVASSYDVAAASWGDTHRASWKKIADRPFVAGGFTWTGFDYHGEPTPFSWPTISSVFGIMDLCGFPKTAFDIHRVAWVDDAPVVSLTPHWSWPGREGNPIVVLVMSNAEQVTLTLNGRAVGTQAVDRLMGNSWSVPYAPGRIEVVARRAGWIVARAAHETVGPPVALRLTPARSVMAGDGEDAQPITIDAVDARGRHVPTANLAVQLAVSGAAIIGLGNGDPNCHEPEQSAAHAGARSLFNGLAQLIVRGDVGRGRVLVEARADALKPARLSIDRLAIAPPPQAAVTVRVQRIAQWRRSMRFADRPSPDLAPTDGDNNSWAFIRAPTPTPPDAAGGWQLYRTTVEPWRAVAARGGTLRFASVGGRAELWIDGQRVADKAAGTGAIMGQMPAGAGQRRIVLLVQAERDTASGLLGPVTLAAD